MPSVSEPNLPASLQQENLATKAPKQCVLAAGKQGCDAQLSGSYTGGGVFSIVGTGYRLSVTVFSGYKHIGTG